MKPIVTRPNKPWVQIVASIPHGGQKVPDDIASKLLIDMDRNYADWYTPDLYSFLPDLRIPTIVATSHRLVADVNRSPLNGVSQWPKGVVPTTSARDEPLYQNPISDREYHERLALAHQPYHQALDELIADSLIEFDSIVLLDLHSFGMPLGVDVVLGNKNGKTTDANTFNTIHNTYLDHGFSTRLNRPFSGGWILERFQNHNSVHAVQIELNQRVYLDPIDIDKEDWKKPPLKHQQLKDSINRIRSLMEDLILRLRF